MSIKKLFLFFIFFIFLIRISSAQLDIGFSDGKPVVEIVQAPIPINYSLQNVNNSQYWDGLDSPADISHSSLANLAWSSAGHTMDANLDMNTKDINNVFDLGVGNQLIVGNDIKLTDKLEHDGDADTYFDFNPNNILLVAGGTTLLDLATTLITLGANLTSAFDITANYFYGDGSALTNVIDGFSSDLNNSYPRLDSENIFLESQVINKNLDVGNITAIFVNRTEYVAQYHRQNTINTGDTNWNNITWDVTIDEETTIGFDLINGNNTAIIKAGFTGIVRVQGCNHYKNNQGSSLTSKALSRVLVNNVEAKCTQDSESFTKADGEFMTRFWMGTIFVNKGDEIVIQYKVGDIDIDLQGDTDFDNSVASSVNLMKIGNDI